MILHCLHGNEGTHIGWCSRDLLLGSWAKVLSLRGGEETTRLRVVVPVRRLGSFGAQPLSLQIWRTAEYYFSDSTSREAKVGACFL